MMKNVGRVHTDNLKTKKEKAITLIALVITIIVLLILAGVTVATLTGENGLLSKAQLAKEKAIEAEQDENEKLDSIEDLMTNGESRAGLSEQQIRTIIREEIASANKEEVLWTNPNPGSSFATQTVSWTTEEYNRVYVVYNNYYGDEDNNRNTVILYPGKTSYLSFPYIENSSAKINVRTATFNASKKSVTFGSGLPDLSATSNDYVIIPLYIIGFKSTVDF